jgi:hypothetical protein
MDRKKLRGKIGETSKSLARMNRRNGSPMHPWHQPFFAVPLICSWCLRDFVLKIRQKTRLQPK